MVVFQKDDWTKPVNVPRKTMLSQISGSIGLKITFASFFFKGLRVEEELNCVADGFCVIYNVQVGSSGEPPDLWSGDTRFESGH